MRTREEVDEVLALAQSGLGASAIARRTGIPRGTVRDWMRGRAPRVPVAVGRPLVPAEPYSRLLGLYLGDGHIVRMARTYLLRIFFDAKYPGLIGEAVRTVRLVAPVQRVAVFRNKPTNCVVLRCQPDQLRWLPDHQSGPPR